MSYQIINGEYVRMRREDELPQDMTEQSIENALVGLGVDREDLEFRTVMGPDKQRYIRYRYWKPLPISNSEFAELPLYESIYEDDGCGYKYMYELKF
jgi:hypothetical protein